MNDPLATYLHDHLAGARFAVEMLEALQRSKVSRDIASFAEQMLSQIEADRGVLEELAVVVSDEGGSMKGALAWLAEKASRLKLRRETDESLGVFETLETLSLGILGKKALWDALATVVPSDPRLAGPDYGALAIRAYQQHLKVEAKRIEIAKQLFHPVPAAAGGRGIH